MNISGAWAGSNIDSITLQHSNDSGVTWFNTQTLVRPPTTLTSYGNFTVTTAFPSIGSLNNAQVRLLYVRVGAADGVSSGIDGVELYVTYTPPDTAAPNVSLESPENAAWRTSLTVAFNYTPQEDVGIANCTLFVNGSSAESNQSIVQNYQQNTISHAFSQDGSYAWNVTCMDTSSNAGTAPAARIVYVDTTAPNVSLVAPGNNSIETEQLITFQYNVSDFSSITSCQLVVDGIVKQTDDTIVKDMLLDIDETLANGDYLWYVNCTDARGWVGQSETFNVSVQSVAPSIVADFSSYEQGVLAAYTGENWQPGENISVRTALPNGTSVTQYDLADGLGHIELSFAVGYGYPIGTYALNASAVTDPAKNASTTYVVTARQVSLSSSAATYPRGETVVLAGIGFSPNTTVNLTIQYIGSVVSVIITANDTGRFVYDYPLSLAQPLGAHNVSAFDRNYSNLAANTTFDVTERMPTVSANRTQYGFNETVGVRGTLFLSLSNTLLRIFDTLTLSDGPGFPTTISTNASGGFSYSWYANQTCSGNYTVYAEDIGDVMINASTTFIIDNNLSVRTAAIVSSVTGNRVTASLANVNSSNDIRQPVGLSSTVADGYLQFGFNANIPKNASFTSVNVTIEQYRTSSRPNGFQFYIVKGSNVTLVTGAGCSGTPPDADATSTCNFAGYITNSSEANNLVVRVNYTRTGSGPGDVEVDHVNVTYAWVGDPIGCFVFGGSPTPPAVIITETPGTVVLNAGTRTAISCTATVTDANGADDITGANATFYLPPTVGGDADDNLTHYTNTSCEQTGSTGNAKTFVCSASLLFYAQNGTWDCEVTGTSIDGISSSVAQFSVDPLYAINLSTAMIDFGDLQTGQVSDNVSVQLANLGNQPINISVYGYGGSQGDGNAFTCIDLSNITIDAIRFSTSIVDDYAIKTNLSGNPQQLNMQIASQISPITAMQESYWQTRVPSIFSGTGICTGVIIYQAEMT
jgi:hypothetical protein